MDLDEREHCKRLTNEVHHLAAHLAGTVGEHVPAGTMAWDAAPLAWKLACAVTEYYDDDHDPEGCRIALEAEAVHLSHVEDESRDPDPTNYANE